MDLWSRIRDLLGADSTRLPREVVKAAFQCHACKDIAATAYYVPRGMAHPRSKFVSEKCDRLVIDGFFGHVTEVIPKGVNSARRAVQKSDPEALWRINPLWAPFYCPACKKSYCQKHWTTQVAFADDYPGWYEHTSGRCPNGHTRLLDD